MRDTKLKFISMSLIASIMILLQSYFLFPSKAFAAPAAPVVVTLTQPDGGQFKAISWGDEWINGMETIDGYTILRDSATDYWFYAKPNSNGHIDPQLKGQFLIVGKHDPLDIPKHLRPEPEKQTTDDQDALLQAPSQSANMSLPNIGEQNILVLLVDFQDEKGSTTPAHWAETIFGQTNSLKHYYDEISFGKLDLKPAEENNGFVNDGIVGWLTMDYNHPNTRSSLSSDNLRIVSDAIYKADQYIDFAAFDKDQNGYLSYEELHVVVIVAGNESAFGGIESCPPSIWAHNYYLDFVYINAPTVDGVKVASYNGDGGYSQFGEIHCEPQNFPGHPATIGVIAHEFGHDLNWPDLYDTSLKTRGIGDWGLMSTGMWNRNDPFSPYYGNSPALPTAWSRWYQGWISPIQIEASILNFFVSPVQNSGLVYQLRQNPFGVDWVFNQRSGIGEYFLVENRPKIGYDSGLPGAGLLIWHINESVTFTNKANATADNRLVDLVQADGLRQLNTSYYNDGDAGDPFPGNTNNSVFNASSNPSSYLNSSIPSGVSLTEIEEGDPIIKANFFVTTFNDVLPVDWSWKSVEALVASGVTDGCGDGNFCPERSTTRSEMAVLLIRAQSDLSYAPPAASGVFMDVEETYWAAGWIEELYALGITIGCEDNPLLYCPENPVSRAEMAVFLLRSKYGKDYKPPITQSSFEDINDDYWAKDWIEQLYQEGITTGCSSDPLLYCPENTVTRAEIAAFLVRIFDFPTP